MLYVHIGVVGERRIGQIKLESGMESASYFL